MKVTSTKVMLMVEEDQSILMGKFMKVCGIWIKLMDMEFTSIKTEQRMREIGKKIFNKVKGVKNGLMDRNNILHY